VNLLVRQIGQLFPRYMGNWVCAYDQFSLVKATYCTVSREWARIGDEEEAPALQDHNPLGLLGVDLHNFTCQQRAGHEPPC
jgi:hypothetical protein